MRESYIGPCYKTMENIQRFPPWRGCYPCSVSSSRTRDELVATLEEMTRLHEQLTGDARNPAVPVTDLIAQISALERLDDRRDELIGTLRRETSADTRAARPMTSIREALLDVLDELGWPQNAGFLEEFLWTTRQLHVESRAFAPLRRDEQRAWIRGKGVRPAYIAPALNADGTPNPRWITSSAWDLDRRVVVSELTEHLFDVQKILSLARYGGDNHDTRQRRPVDALIERYAEDVLGIDPLPPTADAHQAASWRAQTLSLAKHQAESLRKKDDARRKKLAAQLHTLSDRERVWGRPRSTETRSSGKPSG